MLALDHLTVAEATPSQLVEVAAAAGARAVCLFLQTMTILPRMASFSLIGDPAEQRETRARLGALGVGVDLVYPFTLAKWTDIEAFRPAMETAAELGAVAANALVYTRDPSQRVESFERFCALAQEHHLRVALEFYPPSQVRTLEEALALAEVAGNAGVNVDYLHLVRSGGSLAELRAAPAGAIVYGQFSDAPADCPPDAREREASHQRLYPGEGALDVAGFAASLPIGVRTSVEAPRDDLIEANVGALERARRALDSTRRAIAGAGPARG